MPRYEVELQLVATAWIDVEADDEDEAIEAAKEGGVTRQIGWWQVTDASTKLYAEKS